MVNKQACIILLSILLFAIPSQASASQASASKDTHVVEMFGVGFDEIVIADSSDSLNDPRDLEFHPGRANELWIANRASDSITIIQNTGLGSQTSQNRDDSNSNHFLEEVSAIAFGSYHTEFDWQWGSAQESRNTFDGQGSPNNFMGPALWPSSLNHFAVEHQNNGDGLLGSHIDMLHESPLGVGIAHDSANAYWYNDGYYGELVYYDFQADHDTGEDDHSDGIVRRYSDIQLTYASGIPGHMVLDKDSGILYIADAGANRVLWVNTDDTTYTTLNIMGDSSQLESLHEYSRITGMEWGVLSTGLNRPSGIALDGDQLFVSQNANGKISAYELNTNGKVATHLDTVQTSAISIMGLEIGPNGHLYYVDNGRDEIVRIDPFLDGDGDGVGDDIDNCPFMANSAQANHDSDAQGNVCDVDDDNDGILDLVDDCALGNLTWISSSATDHDMDGCADLTEDVDDDNDGINDVADYCALGDLNWTSSSFSDYDLDGCRDVGEDYDDDNDRICDAAASAGVWACTPSFAEIDLCPKSALSFFSTVSNDKDHDGCEDVTEDDNDDNDGFLDIDDDCPLNAGTSDLGTLTGCTDWDEDGYADAVDEFPLESTQWSDIDGDGFGDEVDGFEGDHCVTVLGTSTEDRLGCFDDDNDGWSDPDDGWAASAGADAFPTYSSQHADQDGDGYGDAMSGYQADICPEIAGNSTEDVFGCIDSDGDGWSDAADVFPDDATQYLDGDMDGYGDSATGNSPDGCPGLFGLSTEQRLGCPDSDVDGWDDILDKFPEDDRFWSDIDGDGHPDQQGTNLTDDCPEVAGNSSEDLIGCLDSDADGWSDEGDEFPMDASRQFATESSSLPMTLGILGVVVVGLALLGFALVSRRGKPNPLNIELSQKMPVHFNVPVVPIAPAMPVTPVTPAIPATPPLPPEGLPPGWTMDQWAWYGADYLKNR
ncbi:MAG: hypothetical protein ACKVKS_06255 [Candidatus Poseidoniales archaeon]